MQSIARGGVKSAHAQMLWSTTLSVGEPQHIASHAVSLELPPCYQAVLFGACSEMEPSKSVRQETVGKGTPQSGTVAGESGFTDAQLKAIGGLVEGLLEKALSKARGQSSTEDESGPS